MEQYQARQTKREKRVLRQQQGADGVATISSFNIKNIKPITETQKIAFDSFNDGKHLFLHGSAGTGKTFMALYLALNNTSNTQSSQLKTFIVRSVVPARDMGFLPGNQKEKMKVYEAPYYSICTELYERGDAYDILKQKNLIEFMSTSFIRGITLTDCFVIVDEAQNMSFDELNSIITRAGKNCRFVFCGDFRQDDLSSERYKEQSGIRKFMKIMERMSSVDLINFGSADIVRSGFVKEYIITLEELGYA